MQLPILLLSGLGGAVSTYYLNNNLKLGGVMASSTISVLVAGFFFIFPDVADNYLAQKIPVVVMGASFIGMATQKVIPEIWVIALSGLLMPVIFLLSGSFFEGYGGSLGTTAAISLGAVYVISKFPFRKRSYKRTN